MSFAPALIAQYVMGFLAQLGMGIVAPALPLIQTEFGLSVGEVTLVFALFGVARLVSDLPVGHLADRLPRPLLLAVGLACMAGGAAICAVAPTYPLLLAGRVVQGLGSSLTYTTSQVILVATAAPHERGRAMGVHQAANLAGMILSPAIGGLIAAFVDWRAAFAFCAFATTLGMLSVIATWRVRARRSAPARHLTVASDPRPPSTLTGRALVAVHLLSFTSFFVGQGITNTFVPLYGGTALQLGPAMLGLALGLAGGVRFCVSLIGGFVSDRFGRRAVLVPASVALGAGVLILTLAHDATSFIVVVTLAGLGRLGNGVPATLLADLTPPERLGRTLGFNRFIGDVGQSSGPLLVGLWIDTLGYAPTTWIVTAMVWTAAVGIFIWVPESVPRKPSPRSAAPA